MAHLIVPPDGEPGTPPPFDSFNPTIGSYVGHGITRVSTTAGVWIVDPRTGCVTGSEADPNRNEQLEAIRTKG